MKNIITKFLILIIAIVALSSCEKGDSVVTISAPKEMTAPSGVVKFKFSNPTTLRETVVGYEIITDSDVIANSTKNTIRVPMGYDIANLNILLKHSCMPGEYNVTFRIKDVSVGYTIGEPSEVTTKIIIPESHSK